VPQDVSPLDEYREVLADHRHYEVLRWTVIGLTYPSAFAAVWFAGSRWGFTSGRTYFVLVVSALWLTAGSLVFAQMHFYDRVRIWRARELESEFRPGFNNVSHRSFQEPSEPVLQPWYTRDLAIWFTVIIPTVSLIGSLLAGVVLVLDWLPSDQTDRDIFALWAGNALLVGVVVSFLVKAAVSCRKTCTSCDEEMTGQPAGRTSA